MRRTILGVGELLRARCGGDLAKKVQKLWEIFWGQMGYIAGVFKPSLHIRQTNSPRSFSDQTIISLSHK